MKGPQASQPPGRPKAPAECLAYPQIVCRMAELHWPHRKTSSGGETYSWELPSKQ
jgi:hypothetical protein